LDSLQLPFLSSLTPALTLAANPKKPEMEETLTFPFPGKILSSGSRITSEETDSLRREAIQFFCGIMVKKDIG
jgi:hypothetical protein